MSQITDLEVQERIKAHKGGAKLSPAEIAENTAAMVGFNYTVDDYYEVGREEVRKHARAVEADHPIHWDADAARALGHRDIVGAPTFVSVMGITAQRRLFEDIVVGYDMWQIMQADQRLVFHRPITVGDQLVCDVSLDSFRQMAGTDVMVTKNIMWNQRHEAVLTTWTSLVARPTVEADPQVLDKLEHVMMKVDREPVMPKTVHGPFDRYNDPDPEVDPKPYGALNFDDLVVGGELPPLSKTLTRGNLVNYAGIVGDPNPIHFSDEVAKLIGMDTVVAHGMLTMGLGASFITDFVGDPAAIYEYNVRFTSPVYVYPEGYATLDFTGKIKSLDPQTRRGVVSIVAKQGDRKIFGRAQAHVQFN